MKILAIETSCDETAAAIVEDQNFKPVILTNIVASQLKTHAKTGGVIPDVAARMHAEALPFVLDQATSNKKLDYDAVAVTVGPGLIGCLLLGLSAAKTIAMVTGKPLFAVNHLEGHVYSAWLKPSELSVTSDQFSTPELPALIVIVSGGHTELVLMERHLHYKLLGATRDDAAGEAFDKVARLLGLGYPGGPEIDRLAIHGQPDEFKLPTPLRGQKTLDFSFSGLKASVANIVSKLPSPIAEHTKTNIAASFQNTVADIICQRVTQVLINHPQVQSVCLVGGVAANKHLRTELEKSVHFTDSKIEFFVPDFQYCTDNAAMVGAAAIHHHLFGQPDNWKKIEADPNLSL